MKHAQLTQGEQVLSPSAIDRQLVAVAFADVAGYSRLMALNDVETVRRWKALRTEVIEPHMNRHGGRISDLAGDGVLAEFTSVVSAVRWACDVQRALQRINSEPDSFALHLRIGINVEDVIDDDGMLSGDGVNIASRIHQAAEPGQIVVTGVVRDFVANRLSVVFHDLGSPTLKEYQPANSRFYRRMGRGRQKCFHPAAILTMVIASDRRGASLSNDWRERRRQLLRRRNY